MQNSRDLLVVCSYTDFDNLAHAPRGTTASAGLRAYYIDQDGELEFTSEKKDIMNPAFCRWNESANTLYVCTESIEEDGQIVAYNVDYDGKLVPSCMQSAKGTSTCYLTLDREGGNLLFVNYWDSSLGSLPVNEKGELYPVKGFMQPAKVKSRDRGDHLKNRQLEPHAHALVLDPFEGGNIAFVPDLGRDCVRQYRYEREEGTFTALNEIPSATGEGPHGPRYIEFHSELEIAYVVNELSSIVSVFKYNREAVRKTLDENLSSCDSLELIQEISTVPEGYTGHNTCGRVTVEKSGNFVLVSNRGHDSITSYRINHEDNGKLTLVGIYKTLGKTPRHFQLNHSGELLCAANQDSDTVAMFYFDKKTGELKHTGQIHGVNSPNFVQFIRIEDQVDSAEESGGRSSIGEEEVQAA